MNETTAYIYPSTDNPRFLGVISIWQDDQYYRTEVFAATYLGAGKSKLTSSELSPIREYYYNESWEVEKIDEDEGYRMQHSAAIQRLKNIILECVDIIAPKDAINYSPEFIGDEGQIAKYGVPGFAKLIKDKTKNKELGIALG
jgi:hypothetical protein